MAPLLSVFHGLLVNVRCFPYQELVLPEYFVPSERHCLTNAPVEW